MGNVNKVFLFQELEYFSLTSDLKVVLPRNAPARGKSSPKIRLAIFDTK